MVYIKFDKLTLDRKYLLFANFPWSGGGDVWLISEFLKEDLRVASLASVAVYVSVSVFWFSCVIVDLTNIFSLFAVQLQVLTLWEGWCC